MRIAYCDDEKIQAVFLKELAGLWMKEADQPCTVTEYASAEEMLFENQEAFLFDLILLDIELDKMNGMELARQIRRVDNKVMIAFLSNSRDYVFEGYEVGAVRYLLKPLTRQQLFPLLHMVQKSLEEEKQYVVIGVSGERMKLAVDDIRYVEALGHYVIINAGNQNFEVKMNMNEILHKLNSSFIAVHRSYLVNLEYIERITRKECILSGGLTIPISRNSYKAVNQAFIEFYKGGAL